MVPTDNAATRHGGGVPDGALEGEGQVAALRCVAQITAGDIDRVTGRLLVPRHHHRDRGVVQRPDGVESPQRVEHDEIAPLDVVDPGAENLVALAPVVAARQDRIQMTDEQHPFPLRANPRRHEMAGAAGRRRQRDKVRVKTQRGKFAREVFPHLPDPGMVFRGTVDPHDGLKFAAEIRAVLIDIGGQPLFLGGERRRYTGRQESQHTAQDAPRKKGREKTESHGGKDQEPEQRGAGRGTQNRRAAKQIASSD